MTIQSPESGRWLLERGGRDLFESVDVPRGSGQFGCKLCALTGETVRIPRRQQNRHLAAHVRAVESTKAARPNKGDGTMSGTVTRPEGDLSTQLKRITKRIASTQFQIAHPDKYTKTGAFTDEQKANLEQKLAAERAMREEIRAEIAAANGNAPKAEETKKETLDGDGKTDEHKKMLPPEAKPPVEVTPDPRKKSTGARTARAASTKKTTTAKKTAAVKKTTARKSAAKKTTTAKKTSTRSRAAARKR